MRYSHSARRAKKRVWHDECTTRGECGAHSVKKGGCESSPLKASEVHGLEEKSSLAVTLNLLTVRPNSHHSLKNCGTIGGSLTLTQQFLIVPYPEHPPRNRPSIVLSPTPGRGRVSAPGSPPSRSYVFPAVSDERGEPGSTRLGARGSAPRHCGGWCYGSLSALSEYGRRAIGVFRLRTTEQF